jgi:hypothetical protein
VLGRQGPPLGYFVLVLTGTCTQSRQLLRLTPYDEHTLSIRFSRSRFLRGWPCRNGAVFGPAYLIPYAVPRIFTAPPESRIMRSLAASARTAPPIP